MVAERLDVRLDPDHRRKLDEVAASRGAPVSRVIRELIDQAHEEVDLTRRKAAVLALIGMEIEDVPDLEELSRQLDETYALPDLH